MRKSCSFLVKFILQLYQWSLTVSRVAVERRKRAKKLSLEKKNVRKETKKSVPKIVDKRVPVKPVEKELTQEAFDFLKMPTRVIYYPANISFESCFCRICYHR